MGYDNKKMFTFHIVYIIQNRQVYNIKPDKENIKKKSSLKKKRNETLLQSEHFYRLFFSDV